MTPRSPKYPQVWSLDQESLNQIPPLPHMKGMGFCSLRGVQPVDKWRSPPKSRVSLDVEAVDTTAADEIIGLVQGFLLQVLRAVAVLRHHQDVILQSKDKMGETGSLAEPAKCSPK